jgi:hypothetical protein
VLVADGSDFVLGRIIKECKHTVTLVVDMKQGDILMGDMKELERNDVRYTQNKGDSNSLRVRLETEDIKTKISSYLLGTTRIPYFDEKSQTMMFKEVKVGEPKCNMAGYQAIMSVVEAYINRATVQGNYKETHEMYSYLTRTRKSFTMDLWINMAKYGIKDEEFNGILNEVYILVEPFMTRTIGDGERLTTRETTLQQDRVIQNSGGISFNPFKLFNK